MRIDDNIPGGNVVVEEIADDAVRLRPDLRDTDGWWFYWCFRVREAAGRTVRFAFAEREPVGVRGPAVSADGGASWRWLGAPAGDARSFTYAFPADAGETRFAFTIPHLQSDWERCAERWRGDARFRPGVLCRSPHGRPVECAYVGAPGPARPRLMLTCRHHCCEAMAGYVLEGVIEAVLAGRASEGRWLAEHAELLAAPFVDKDGVEEGDQGKNRRPHDHGRDYGADQRYPETIALKTLAREWGGARLAAVLDLHCPWIRGKHNEEIYIVGAQDPAVWARQQRFGALLEQARRGPLPYRAADNLPYGAAWNTAANSRPELTSLPRWAASLPSRPLAASFEIPYANAGGVDVTPETARLFGHDLAVALGRHLRERSKGD